jgi:hypothetical protein
MPSNGWQSKGDKSVRRSPRQGRRKCARPFTAPRSLTKDKGKTVENEVQVITETENARDIEGRQDEQPQVILFESEERQDEQPQDKGMAVESEVDVITETEIG